MAIQRRATPDDATVAAFALGVEDLPPDVLEEVCYRLGRAERGEFEDKWPELGVIRGHCHSIMRQRAERREEQRRLAEYKPPRNPERLAKFLADVKATIASKSMK